jgi:AcrR family transcriptional regulator
VARLTREDWLDAAYARFNRDGIASVAVEAIARDLGATKGSFYWHFADRQALVEAVLELWRERETEQLIIEVEAGRRDTRLESLLLLVAHRSAERGGERTLYSDSAAAGARATVAVVTERRVAYVTALLADAGLAPDEARRRATIIVSAVIGYQQLVSTGWDAASDPHSLVETLLAVARA